MAGSGIAGSVGVASEGGGYGVYTAPGRFYEADSSNLKKVKNVAQADGLAAGRFVELGSQRIVTTQAAAGDLNLNVLTKGFGLMLLHLLGGSVTPVQQAATAAYLQTFALGDNGGKSLTIQNGLPQANSSGTVYPYTFQGCKILSAEFSCAVDGLLTAKITFDSQQVVETQTLAAPSYVTGTWPFHFGIMGVKLGAFGSEGTPLGVRKVTIKLERPQRIDRFYGNGGGLKSEPLWNGHFNISGSFDVDFVNKTDFADRFAADTSASLIWEFVGPTAIASTYFPTFRIRVPQIFLNGDGQTLDGQDVLTQTYPFVGKFDGANSPVTVEYMSTDTVV